MTELKLNIREWGGSQRVAVLLHGMMADSRCWWEVGPALAARGYHVIAIDFPGHGLSPRCPDADVDLFATAMLGAVPARPALAVAHSMGAFIVAAALARLAPQRVVYVDTPFGPSRAGLDVGALSAAYTAAKTRRTLAHLQRTRPGWQEMDRVVEAEAAKLFDVPTAVSLLASAAGQDYTPPARVPSLMIRSAPSKNVPPEAVTRLEQRGLLVRSVPGADHSVWYGHHEEFMRALDGWI